VDDAVARYRAASDANDIDALVETLTPDVELISPISAKMVFRGREDVRILLGAVYSSIDDLTWHREVGDEAERVVLGDARVGPFKLGDAMVCELADDGRIRRISPHLRPWLALTALALKLAIRMARHPAVLLRALHG
jgi:SnoaL-like domain